MYNPLKILKVNISLLFLCITSSISEDHCSYSKTKQNGVCVPIENCLTKVDDIISISSPQSCYQKNNQTFICCPLEKRDSVEIKTNGNSIKKCSEYKEDLKKYFTIPPDLIIGGSDANLYEFAHMAAVGFGEKQNIQWNCGASLISNKYLLTAAHCLSNPAIGAAKFVRLGDITLDETSNLTQTYEILRRIPHPNYKPPSSYNDIGLIELNETINFTQNIQPSCLYPYENFTSYGAIATGWGLTSFSGSPSNILQKVHLSYFSYEECNKVFGKSGRRLRNGIEDDKMICAGSRIAEKDTCNGDSGGPLHRFNKEGGLYFVVGVTSFGKECGTINIPAVYTKVLYYLPWIESIVWK